MQGIFTSVFNNIYRATRRIKKSTKELVISVCFFSLLWIYFFSSLNVVSNKVQIYGTFIVLIITVFSVNEETRKIEWNKWIYYPMLFFGLGIISISVIHSVGEGYILYALDLIIVFPAFYFVWANRGDYETLLRLLSSATLITGELSFIYCFYLAVCGRLAAYGDRVAGLRANPNTFGRLGVIIVLASLFLLMTSVRKKQVMISASIGLGIGLSYVLLSASRTSILAIILIIIVFVISLIRVCRKIKIRTLMVFFGLIIVSTAFLMAGLQLNDIDYRAKHREREASIQQQKEDVESAKKTEEELAKEKSHTDERVIITQRSKVSNDVNSISSGRIRIWKLYWENSSMLGEEYDVIREQLPKEPYWAHNNVLEYVFRFGYIVGFIYTFFFIAQGIAGIKMLFNKEFFGGVVFFTVSAIGIYSLLAMLDVAVLPFAGCIPCIYFLSITPIVTGKRKNNV